jgi:hypothetical protein
LINAGFTLLEGAAAWKPPLGKPPRFINIPADYTHWLNILRGLKCPYAMGTAFQRIWSEAIVQACNVLQDSGIVETQANGPVVGYVMQARQSGGDTGFSWKEDDENFPRDIWERRPVGFIGSLDAEYLAAYEEECQETMAAGIKFWKAKYEALLQRRSNE